MTLREAVCASSSSRSEGHFFIDSESPTFPSFSPQLGSSLDHFCQDRVVKLTTPRRHPSRRPAGRAREPREGLPESSCTMAEAEAAPAPPPAFPVPPLSSAAWVDETQIQGMAMEAV
jgi:hypothetical protein